MWPLTANCKLDVRLPEKPNKLSSFVSSLPSVKQGFVELDWLLSWPHASTMYSSLANFEKVDHVFYRRHTIWHKDGGNNTLDFATRTGRELSEADYARSGDQSLPPRTRDMAELESRQIGSNTKGILVLMVHGLSGGSHENYIRRSITSIFEQFKDEEEVTVVAFNARGCARSKVTSKNYWNAMQTDDLNVAVNFLVEKYPNRRFIGIGFSLGANILTNFLARDTPSKISVAISVSNPWVLNASNDNLESYWLGRLYSKKMAQGLQKLFKRHSHFLLQHEGVSKDNVAQATSLRQFDDAFTAKAFGFDCAESYYVEASSASKLPSVKTDLIILNAKDDPVALDSVIPYQQAKGNDHICLLAADHGGHIGWFGKDGQRWFVDIIVQTIQGMVEDRV